MLTDSHCHLNFPELLQDIEGVKARMQQAGVTQALCVATTLENAEAVYTLAQAAQSSTLQCWASVGVHPDTATSNAAEPTIENLVHLGGRDRVVAIGETGLDYYHESNPTSALQIERFRTHIRAAQHLGKPLIIHTRQASEDTLRVLDEEGENGQSQARSVGGVFHCFTETQAVARAALDRGFFISFSGILTFKNAQALREVAAFVPLDRCLIETDSPYLAPVPFRGKTNEPAFLPWIARQLALIKGVSEDVIAQETSVNFFRLFLSKMAGAQDAS
jgi:TatD DNase family protein